MRRSPPEESPISPSPRTKCEICLGGELRLLPTPGMIMCRDHYNQFATIRQKAALAARSESKSEFLASQRKKRR